jgi:GTP cyclohydrolase I
MIDLPDVQQTEPKIKIPIRQVGVENLDIPLKLELRKGGALDVMAKASIRTNLSSDVKGISMSRLLLTLKPYLNLPIKSKLIKKILLDLKTNLGSKESFMKFQFNLPVDRKSPVTENKFPIFYKCRFEGQLCESVECSEDVFKFYEGVIIQYASYCPCSAELCKTLPIPGYPHNQRSFAHVLAEVDVDKGYYIWLEDIIEAVESRIKTIPYPIIKRADEKEIARIASENPMFVEDAIREISFALDNINGISDWIVKCVHEESIHTSEAIAINWKGKDGGFNGKRFI